MAVEFHDYRVKVKGAIRERTIAKLYEAAGELTAATQRNVPNRGNWFTEQKNAWTYIVDENKLEATVGNPQERALWTEFGTGEHSISPRGGRRGFWIYVKEAGSDGSGSMYSYKGGKAYTLDEAKKIVAMMRSEGLDAHYTKGQQPHRPLHKAYVKKKAAIVKLFQEGYGDIK